MMWLMQAAVLVLIWRVCQAGHVRKDEENGKVLHLLRQILAWDFPLGRYGAVSSLWCFLLPKYGLNFCPFPPGICWGGLQEGCFNQFVAGHLCHLWARGKWGERLRLRERLSEFKVVLCLGADASHSSRNSIWIMLKFSLWFPIPFRAEGKTQGVWPSHHHCISSTLTLVRSIQDSNTLHILPAPFTNIFLWAIQLLLPISECSHFF